MEFIPPKKGKLDFLGTQDDPGPERIIRWLCNDDDEKGLTNLGENELYNIVMITYDVYQLHSIMTNINNEGLAWCVDFNQGSRRLEADRLLYDLILQRKLWHNGNRALRSHIDNADRQLSANDRRFRLVKRERTGKIDLAVCLSQATHAFTNDIITGVEGGAVRMSF